MKLTQTVRLSPDLACNVQRSQYCRTCGGRTERKIFIMGAIHHDHAPYHSSLHKLHAPTKEDTSCPRDRDIDIRR
jgi:hypothetical protein